MDLLEQFKQIRTFVFDMDGVLTDGSVIVISETEHLRTMHVRDGYAIQQAVKKGYEVVIISGGISKPAAGRLEYLGVKNVYMKVKDKADVLSQFLSSHNLKWEETLFMGDDIPDVEVMKLVGLAACPADATPEVKAVSNYISTVSGGRGCARDVIEKVLKLNGDWITVSAEIAAQ